MNIANLINLTSGIGAIAFAQIPELDDEIADATAPANSDNFGAEDKAVVTPKGMAQRAIEGKLSPALTIGFDDIPAKTAAELEDVQAQNDAQEFVDQLANMTPAQFNALMNNPKFQEFLGYLQNNPEFQKALQDSGVAPQGNNQTLTPQEALMNPMFQQALRARESETYQRMVRMYMDFIREKERISAMAYNNKAIAEGKELAKAA